MQCNAMQGTNCECECECRLLLLLLLRTLRMSATMPEGLTQTSQARQATGTTGFGMAWHGMSWSMQQRACVPSLTTIALLLLLLVLLVLLVVAALVLLVLLVLLLAVALAACLAGLLRRLRQLLLGHAV